MSQHAFARNPEQMSKVVDNQAARLEGETGIIGRWDMPVADWISPRIWDHPVAGFPHHTLCMNLKGAPVARISRDGSVDWVAPGCLALMPAEDDPRRWRAEAEVAYRHFYFKPAFLAKLAAETHDASVAGWLRYDAEMGRDAELGAMLADYSRRAADGEHPPIPLEMDCRAVLIGLHLLRRYGTEPLPQEGRSRVQPLQRWRLRRVFDHVDAHLDRSLRLDELARVAGLSPCHFSRSFKAATGVSVHRYLQVRRVERARELLAGTDLPIAAVALECGFANQAHFTTLFRIITGTTPARFRREAGRAVDPAEAPEDPA